MKDGKIKITVEAYGKKNIVEMPDDCDIYEIFEVFTSQLYFLTFGRGAILNGLMGQADNLRAEEKL